MNATENQNLPTDIQPEPKLPETEEPGRRVTEVGDSVPEEEGTVKTSQVSSEAEVPLIDAKESTDFEDKSSGMPFFLKILIGFFVVGFIGLLAIVVLPKIFKPQSSNVTLNYWGLWEDPNIMQKVISEFESQNPQIKINYTKEDPKEYSDRLLTRIKNGSGPDIFRFHNSWMPMLQSILTPLPNSVISKSDFTNSYYPVIQSDLIKNGAIYAIPLEIDTLSLFVNTQLFQAAGLKIPTTWTDFVNTSRSLTVKDQQGKIKTAGAALGTFDNITHAPDIVSMLFLQNGADFNDLIATSQNASDALSFYGSFAKDQANVWDNTLDQSIKAFANGTLAMYFGYSWDIFTIKQLNPQLQFSVNPVPHLPNRNMTVASYWVEGVSNKSQHQKEALLFMKFLAKKETEMTLFSEESKTRPFGELYPRADLADSLKDNQLIYPFIQQAKDAKSSYFAGETQDTQFSAQMNGYLGNAVRAVLGNTSAQSAMDTLSKGVQQILDQYATSTH